MCFEIVETIEYKSKINTNVVGSRFACVAVTLVSGASYTEGISLAELYNVSSTYIKITVLEVLIHHLLLFYTRLYFSMVFLYT